MIIGVWWVEWRGVDWMCIVFGFLRNLMGWIVGYWCICSNIFIGISFIIGIRCFGFRWIIYWVVYRMNFIDYGVIFMRCCRVFLMDCLLVVCLIIVLVYDLFGLSVLILFWKFWVILFICLSLLLVFDLKDLNFIKLVLVFWNFFFVNFWK